MLCDMQEFGHISHIDMSYPEIGDANFWCALWTFKQQLTLKMSAHCRISTVLLQASLYCDFRDMVLCICSNSVIVIVKLFELNSHSVYPRD